MTALPFAKVTTTRTVRDIYVEEKVETRHVAWLEMVKRRLEK